LSWAASIAASAKTQTARQLNFFFVMISPSSGYH
jgi:hypothetical protein